MLHAIVALAVLCLGGVILLQVVFARKRVSDQIGACASLVHVLEQCAKEYELDYGRFPPPEAGGVALLGDKYFIFNPDKLDSQGQILDPWSRPLIYRVRLKPGAGLNEVLIYSTGPNGVDEGGLGDDISSDS